MMTSADDAVDAPPQEAVERFQTELLDMATRTLNLFAIHLGHRLGYYEVLAEKGPLTAPELAEATGTHPRYAREWLEHQAVNGVLEVADDGGGNGAASADDRRFALDPAKALVLTDRDGLDYLTPLIQTVVGATQPIDAVEEAYRTGGGVAFGDYGVHMRQGQAGMNRAMFLHLMGSEWVPAMPDVDERLRSGEAAKVADVGCGAGWSCIGLANAYPAVRVDGFDLDEESVELARRNVKGAGLGDRVRILRQDASDPDLEGDYDLVTAFECVHDMARPADALAAMRNLAGDDGAVLVMDERVGASFDDRTEIEPLMYGWSVVHCLPAGRAEEPTEATGTVLRPGTMEALAEKAGFSDVEVLPIENVFFRFYRLRP